MVGGGGGALGTGALHPVGIGGKPIGVGATVILGALTVGAGSGLMSGMLGIFNDTGLGAAADSEAGFGTFGQTVEAGGAAGCEPPAVDASSNCVPRRPRAPVFGFSPGA